MKDNLKSILTFIAVFLFLIIAGFNSLKYWDKQDKEIELTREQSARDNQNDSLLNAVKSVQCEMDLLENKFDSIMQVSNQEYINRNNSIINSKKRNEQLQKNPAHINRRNNDEYIINYKPEFD